LIPRAAGAGDAYDPCVLIGREAEEAAIEAVVDGARAHRAGVLVLRGEAGVGKTTLLESAVERASDFRILRSTGMQSERELPFAGLHSLVQPLLGEIQSLPEPQARALGSAFAVGPSAEANAFATYAAVLGLLANAAAREPILVVIDDVQFLDKASSDALGFILRRLRDEAIAVLIGLRTEEPSTFEGDGLPTLGVEALSGPDARALLETTAPGAGADAQRRILDLAQGNPLALVELPRLLASDQAGSDGPLGRTAGMGHAGSRGARCARPCAGRGGALGIGHGFSQPAPRVRRGEPGCRKPGGPVPCHDRPAYP
jgi:hypothetical protein